MSIDEHWPAISALEGVAAEAKGGSVLLLGPGRLPIYLPAVDGWSDALLGKSVQVQGRIVQDRLIPEAQQDESGAWSQGVAAGSGPQWVMTDAAMVERAEAPVAMPIALMQSAWPEYADCLRNLAAALGSPDSFLVAAEVEKREGRYYVFALWHRDAFLPEMKEVIGNPGGQCRNALCVIEDGSFEGFLFWQ